MIFLQAYDWNIVTCQASTENKSFDDKVEHNSSILAALNGLITNSAWRGLTS